MSAGSSPAKRHVHFKLHEDTAPDSPIKSTSTQVDTSQVNGQDLSSASHEEAVEAFCAAKEPIVVEVLRRVGKGSSRMKAQPPAMVSVATQTDKAIEGPFFSLFHPPPPPPPEETCCFNPAGSLWQPASRHPVAFPNSDLGLTDIEMTNGMDYDDMYEDERQIDVEYEEVTLHRSSSEEKVGLTLYYGSPDDDVTDIYISEIEPCSIAACDGRIREGDQILQINGIDVHSREQAIRLFSESRSNITLLLARQVQTDDGFLEDQSMLLEGDLHHNLLVHPRHHPGLPVHHRLQVHDEEGGTTDTATTENSHKHEKDSGVGRTDESTRNDESSEQEINEGECGSPASNPRSHGASSLGVGDHHYSNDSFTSSEMQEAGELPAEDLSQTQCDKFRQVLEHRCANVEARYPPKMTRKDSQSSIDREIAMLNKEMEEIQMECQEIVEMHTRHQHKGHGNDPRLDIFRSPRMVPRMGTKLDYAKQILAAHDGPDAVWLRHEQKLQGWQEKKEADGRGSMSAPVTPAREPERDKDTSNTSAYNTGDSCRSTPAPLTLELSQAADTVADKNQGSMLSLTIPVQKPSHSDSEKMAADQGFGVRECSSDGDGIKPGELKKSHSSNSVSRMSQTPNGDITEAQVDSLQDIYAQYADVMYTNRENLEHTMMVQQKLFQQKLAGRQQNGKDGNSVSPTATEAGTGQQGAVAVGSDASTTQMEWVVKRRADGTRYITRRPVRNKILKERAKKLAEERAGMTTDDDAVSELKTGRYWSKEDRKRHLERARDHKRRKEFMMKARMETLKEGDEQKKEPNIVELSHRKMMKHKGKKVFDNFTTVQEMLAHGSRLPEGSKTYNPLLSVTTV